MGDPAKASICFMPQVKVYHITKEGKRNERGSGHVFIENLERSEDLGLIVIDEEDNNTILLHRISYNCAYERQDNTISWTDPELAIELALDFPVTSACSYIWENINKVRNDLSSRLGIGVEIDSHPAKEPEEATSSQSSVCIKTYSRRAKRSYQAITTAPSRDDSFPSENDEVGELPSLELSTLPIILENILARNDQDRMDVPELLLRDPEYFQKLVNLFRVCEKSQNMDGLHMICKLVKAIILLNSPEIFDRILSDVLILDIIGTLEYDPDVPQVRRHRTFLKENVVYKEAIHIGNAVVLSKIHRSYRISYLKDTILPTVLDSPTKETLETILKTNNAFVISLLKDNASFIQELFNRMRSYNTSTESKVDLVLFLHEFCSLSKYLSLLEQIHLLRDLAAEGIFDITADVLRSCNQKLLSAGTGILFRFLEIVPSTLTFYIIQQDDKSFLGLLVQGLITGLGCDIHGEVLEIFRQLMSSKDTRVEQLMSSKDTSTEQQERILEIFCEGYLDELMDAIELCCPPKNGCHSAESDSTYKPESLLNICELLRFCVIYHFDKIKFYFLFSNVIEKILYLTRRREMYLVVAAVRFMRTIIAHSANDEHILPHIVQNNLLKPIIDAFTENGDHDNMLHSGVLELLEYIWQEDIELLFAYLLDSFWEQLEKFGHLETIQALFFKHEESSHEFETKDTCDTIGPKERIDKSDEGDDTRSESHKQDQISETSKPDATEVDEKAAGSTGNADQDDRDNDDGDHSPQSKKTKSPADDEEPSSSSAANREPEQEASRKRKSF